MCTKCVNSSIVPTHPYTAGVIVGRTYIKDKLVGVLIRKDGKLVNILKDISGVAKRPL